MKKHLVLIESKRFYFIFKRFRAKCKGCTYCAPWRQSERAAVADGWYHDDATLYKTLTEKHDVD